MAGVGELFATAGYFGTELFKYNRKAYEFDNDQRFEREELRLKMQVARFRLFRDDIRDLVCLTVGKMDLYHLIGALLLKMAIIYYCQGRLRGAVPPYLLVLYHLSAACAFMFLLLAIWLAMHASVSAHSYGTRLLTRFVRLPIPSADQIATMNARYADFERHGKQMLRVPFVQQANEWRYRSDFMDDREDLMNAARGLFGRRGAHDLGRKQIAGVVGEDLLGQGDSALGEEEELLHAVDFRTERHVQLFRRLQAKWQCFDAYSRVCMALGMRQMLQVITYYLMGVCMVENQSPTIALSLVLVMQTIALLLQTLDIYKAVGCCGNFDLQLMGTLPALNAYASLFIFPIPLEGNAVAKKFSPDEVAESAEAISSFSVLPCFFLEAVWFQLLLRVSRPSQDDAGLPSHWRSVLFMDVFSEGGDSEVGLDTGLKKVAAEERSVEEIVVDAESAFMVALCALRRWAAVPPRLLSRHQQETLKNLQEELTRWRWPSLSAGKDINKVWSDFAGRERIEDPFAGCLLGPLELLAGYGMSTDVYWDLECQEYRYQQKDGIIGAWRILTLEEATRVVQNFSRAVEAVMAARDRNISALGGDGSSGEAAGSASSSSDEPPLQRHVTRRAQTLTREEAPVVVVPERLPWKLVNFMIRVAQVVWLITGFLMLLRSFKVLVLDFESVESMVRPHYKTPFVRHLAGDWVANMEEEMPLDFLPNLTWPFRSFFRPSGLHCGVGPVEGVGHHRLLVGSSAALYEASVGAADVSEFQAFLGPPLPRGAAAICGAATILLGGDSCFLAAPCENGGLRLWASLSTASAPLRLWLVNATLQRQGSTDAALTCSLVAGTVLSCDLLPKMWIAPSGRAAWCLLVACHTDGVSGVTIVAAAAPISWLSKLQDQLVMDPSVATLVVLHQFRLPTAMGKGASISAVHVEDGSGRIFAASSSGHIVAWDILNGEMCAVWRLTRSAQLQTLTDSWSWAAFRGGQRRSARRGSVVSARGFRVTGVCSTGNGFFLAGVADGDDVLSATPWLARARLP